MRRGLSTLLGSGAIVLAAFVPGALGGAAAPPPSGSFALSGAEAAAFTLPPDVVQAWTATHPDGTTQTRFQQKVGDALVLGGQFTVLRRRATTTAVIGAYYPRLVAKNTRALGPAEARRIAEQRIGGGGGWSVGLRIDPSDGRLFYEVENRRPAQRWIHWVDAGNGDVRKAYDAIAYEGGTASTTRACR